MEVDSMHATIEHASSKIEIFTPIEWETVIKTARCRKPYNVVSVDHTFWKRFPGALSTIRPGKRAGDPVVTDIRHLKYSKDGIFYSLTHGTPLLPLSVRGLDNIKTPVSKYKTRIKLNDAKLSDLKDLSKSIIPLRHQGFYEHLV